MVEELHWISNTQKVALSWYHHFDSLHFNPVVLCSVTAAEDRRTVCFFVCLYSR